MLRHAILALACACALVVGCGSTPEPGRDTGTTPGMDSGTMPGEDTGTPGNDAFVARPDVGPGLDGGCVPSVEICGDHMDQNCDGHDQSCGDQDHDGFEACRPPTPDFSMCDCDDSDINSYPARTGLAGGQELCDMKDNDCDGTVDESAACCDACNALTGGGAARADTCIGGGPGGACACAGEGDGTQPCAAGETCCSDGCVNTMTDVTHCGSCQACTDQADRCLGGTCSCGTTGMSCSCNGICTSGTCGGCH